MALRKAERRQAKLRIGMAGLAGSGKTLSALFLARGLASAWNKVVIIDTENGSADLYSEQGDYFVFPLKPPYSPQNYIEVIKECEKAGMEVIIIDSITHEWSGDGGCLELHDLYTEADKRKNSYSAWGKVTPLHRKFIDTMLQSSAHIITTVRTKQDYEMVSNGKGGMGVKKVGTKEITREGFEYELTINFEMQKKDGKGGFGAAAKDRTGLFDGTPLMQINTELGEQIKEWNQSGAKTKEIKEKVVKEVVTADPAPDSLIAKLKKECPKLAELNKKCGTSFKSWGIIQKKEATDLLFKLM